MNNCAIVMYHYVRHIKDSRYPGIKGLEVNQFKRQIEFLTANFRIISTEQLIRAATEKSYELPDNAALLTFDDGYIDHFTNVYPVLKEHNIHAFFSMPSRILSENKLLDVNKIHFILAGADTDDILLSLYSMLDHYRGVEFNYPDNEELFDALGNHGRHDNEKIVFIKSILQHYLPEILRNMIVDELFKKYVAISESAFAKELYMSYEQLKLLKREGMYIGLHGFDHLWLNKKEQGEMENDILKALVFFDELIDRTSWVMCYPYGGYNEGVVKFAGENGCKIGFTTEVKEADLSACNPLILPRLDTNDFPPKSDNYRNILTHSSLRQGR